MFTLLELDNSLMIKNSAKFGFSLAEVLVTILILGVITSVTIPTLISKTRNAQYKSAFRSVYQTLEQATQMIMTNRADPYQESMQKLCADGGHTCFRDAYKTYLSYAKSCDTSLDTQCWQKTGALKFLNGGVADYNNPGLLLNNGMMMVFEWDVADCTQPNQRCGAIIVDVNGQNPPNIIGRDVFSIVVALNGTIQDGDGTACDGQGWDCGAYYMTH